MAKIAFLGDCYINHQVLIPSIIPENIVLNWEHAFLFPSAKAGGKVVLGLEKTFYKETFSNRFVVAGLANNHAADFGAPGIAGAIRQINDAGYVAGGASLGAESGSAVCLEEFDGKLIAFLFYSHPTSSPITQVEGRECVSMYDRDKAVADVYEAKRLGACYIVAVVHWGAEEVTLPPPAVVSDARFLVEAGVDLVVGHHAHVVQPMEVYKGKYIFYGLGNFYFPDFSTTVTRAYGEETFAKRQAPRNKKSLAVVLDTDEFSVSCLKCKADLKGRRVRARPIKPIPSSIISSSRYSSLFRISFISGKLLAKMWSVAVERRLPKKSALKSMLALLKSRSFK